jgi:hypothetical protein
MERVRYYEERERTLSPQIKADYYSNSGLDSAKVMAQRTVCVDRIFRLGYCCAALDSTCFAAVRLFDRCMSVLCSSSVSRTNMMLLAIACFDIAHKVSDSDYKQPDIETYYAQAMNNHCNDYTIKLERLPFKLMEAEITVLKAVSGEPVGPTAQDYISECCPSWFSPSQNRNGRRVSLLCSAFLYMGQSVNYSAEEIAAAAASLEIGDRTPPSPEMTGLCSKIGPMSEWTLGRMMVEAVDKLFAVGRGTGMYYMYRDIYNMWADEQVAVSAIAQLHEEKVIESM